MNAADQNIPILVGVAQLVEHEASLASPMSLAARAAAAAIIDCGGTAIAAAIDTIAVTRLFSDSVPAWSTPLGRSNNPPQSIARHIGAIPRHRIYGVPGGNEPQSRLIEFAADIARGDRSTVLLAGAEAIRNMRHIERNGLQADWNEHYDEPLEDRGYGKPMASSQERRNGLVAPIYYYSLIEQARRHTLGRSIAEHRLAMARLFAEFSKVAARNPFAQFPIERSIEDIDAATPLTHLYSKRMVAQDGVNQAAALLLTSVGRARELGIAPERWVYMHGMAEGSEHFLSERPDPARSVVAAKVLERAFTMAGRDMTGIDLIDIYSCFPCAVSAIADELKLPDDGSRCLTLTGGLPFFGGPGNNYSMHGIAEAVRQLRQQAAGYALVSCNGGLLSKHASGIYSRQPSRVDWNHAPCSVGDAAPPAVPIAAAPARGRILSYTLNYGSAGVRQAVVLACTAAGEHFVACTAPEALATIDSMQTSDPTGRWIVCEAPRDETLHFSLAAE